MVIQLNSFYHPENNEKENQGLSIVITCSPPSKNGKIQVEMKSEGDPWEILYVLEQAMIQVKQMHDMS